VLEALPMIARGEDIARAGGMPEEVIQRNLSRAIDRMTNLCTIESGVIALEYVRYRTRLIRGTM
jgi:hypothetical protein